MGYHHLPSMRYYWATDPDLGVSFVSLRMSRNRFEDILRNSHDRDNLTITAGEKDTSFKLQPMIDLQSFRFKQLVNPGTYLSVDKSIILFKERSTLRQYKPMKPIKRGYKLWCLACMSGYANAFIVYLGRVQAINCNLGFGLGGRVVRQMTECLTEKEHIVIFDNFFFSSVSLLEQLKEDSIFACSTILSNRKGLTILALDRTLNRGSFDQKHCGSIGVY
ncbi:hypothetical protein QYM36_015538 [Artemia franciscana]|uniref:PiggyBac transposable element-derived protein domain-containing protein n=1 Tax=Artemia franciscana TaxID=6661 RepID=A0AA88HIX6_ARTSF|nr:hypothetical protein QYM36_015538 [Artemia franciscana]